MKTRTLGIAVIGAAMMAPVTAAVVPPSASGGTLRPAAIAPGGCFSTDNGDPAVTSVSISPTTVDARESDQQVTVSLATSDTGGPGPATGTVGGWVDFSDGIDGWSAALAPDGLGNLVGQFTVGQREQHGWMGVSSISVWDDGGNRTDYDWMDLEELGLGVSFLALTTPFNPGDDLHGPVLNSLDLLTPTVDTREHPGIVRLRLRATDDHGVQWVSVALDGRTETYPNDVARLRRVRGDARQGVWVGRIRIPRWKPTNAQELVITLADNVNQSRYLRRPDPYDHDLDALGLPSTVRILGEAEPARPRIRIRSVRPTSIDVRSQVATVTVAARITDRGSGVRTAAVRIGDSTRTSAKVRMRLVSGTRHDGVWRGTARVDPCQAIDGPNVVYVNARDVEHSAWTHVADAVAVSAADHDRPNYSIVDWFGVPADGPVVLQFTEDVRGVGTDDVSVYLGSAARGREEPAEPVPGLPGTWSCRSAADTAVDCLAGPVRVAAFTPSDPFTSGTYYLIDVNPEHHLGLTDLVGNPYYPRELPRYLGGKQSFRPL